MGHVDRSNSGSNKLLTYYLCTTYNRVIALVSFPDPTHPCWDWGLGTRLDYNIMSWTDMMFGKGGH